MAHGATLDSHELSFLRDVLKSAANGRINVEQAVECVEQMDFLIDGDIGDLVKSVVPDAFDADALSLQDVVKVATAAKAQEGTAQTSGLTLDREDSLTELQNSFHQQMVSGEIPEQISQGPPPPPPPSPPRGVNRDDSLAQLEMSFNRQVMSGDVPEPIAEGVENGNGRSPVFGVDVPQRRRSVAGGTPTSQTPPPRRDPFRSDSLSAFERPFRSHDGGSPILVDLPHRRTSIATRPGGSILIGVEPGGPPVLEDDDSTLPASPEFARQTSEEELLDAAGTLGLDPVQASNVPQKRRSFVVSQGWEEAAAQDHRRSVGGTTVSYEDVNHRQGSAWWQCLVCAPNVSSPSAVDQVEDTDVGDDDEDYAAAVDKIKPEMWIKSDGRTASTRSVGADARPSKGDVCTIM